MMYYGIFSDDGFAVYNDPAKAQRACNCLNGTCKTCNSKSDAKLFAVNGYNLSLKEEKASDGYFDENNYVGINRIYFRREILAGDF